mgnify:CR=1 FL=1
MDGSSNQEVSFGVVLARDLGTLFLALHKSATHATTVFVANLIYLNRIITTVKRNDEGSIFVIRLGRHQLCVESKDVHILFEHFFHVKFRNLGLESQNTAHRILFSAIAG